MGRDLAAVLEEDSPVLQRLRGVTALFEHFVNIHLEHLLVSDITIEQHEDLLKCQNNLAFDLLFIETAIFLQVMDDNLGELIVESLTFLRLEESDFLTSNVGIHNEDPILVLNDGSDFDGRGLSLVAD